MAAQSGSAGSGTELVAALLRGLRLMESFGVERPEMTLAELVKACGYSKTSTHRLLTTLSTPDGSSGRVVVRFV